MFAARALSCLGLEACASMSSNCTCIPLVIVRGLHNRSGFLMASNFVAGTADARATLWEALHTSLCYSTNKCQQYEREPDSKGLTKAEATRLADRFNQNGLMEAR
jgi:hypothetical protein